MLRTALGESTASLDSTTRSGLCTHCFHGVNNTLAVMPSLSPYVGKAVYQLLLLTEHKWDCLGTLPLSFLWLSTVCAL